jgi:hypothetical protein
LTQRHRLAEQASAQPPAGLGGNRRGKEHSADRLLPRARELAEAIMKAPRTARHLTYAIAQRPWERRLFQDLGFGLAHEPYAIHADGRLR